VLPAAAAGPHGGGIAWGCGGFSARGQCRVPASARSGVIAIAAGVSHSLALLG